MLSTCILQPARKLSFVLLDNIDSLTKTKEGGAGAGADDYMNISSKLEKLNFTTGIRAASINKNFETVHNWVTKERRTLGGYGIIDGFIMSSDNSHFVVSVSEGHMITNDGEEVTVDGAMFTAGAPESTKAEYTVVCSKDGIAELPVRPYSDKNPGYIEYLANDNDYPAREEFYVSDAENGDRVQVLQIIDRKLYVDADIWAYRKLKVEMLTADNRIDSVLLSSEGSYNYEKGIISTSPSHVDASDYPGWFLVGTVEWQIKTECVEAKFYTNHRTYRKIYVNDDNDLFLNGRLYHDAQLVHFTEPETPEENDLWYDKVSNNLMVWQLTQDGWEWINVNDHASKDVRTCKMWAPDDFPADNRTFLFQDDETDMRYVPGTNALDIIIDNAVLMRDQYEEIVRKVDAETSEGVQSYGIGFKLKDPLDKETYVQCTAHHSVRSRAAQEAFQKAAVFVEDDYCTYSEEDNPGQVFSAAAPYVVGEEQLEVFVDGVRLTPDLEFKEMISSTTVATEADMVNDTIIGQTFKIVKPLQEGQVVAHRIMKHVWSYDHVARLMNDITSDTKEALAQCRDLQKNLTGVNKDAISRDDGLAKEIKGIKEISDQVSNCFMKTETIPLNNMDESVKRHMISNVVDVPMPATKIKPIEGVTSEDFIQVHIISPSESRVLIKGIDYALTDGKDGVRVSLKSELMLPTATIYVTGFKIGA